MSISVAILVSGRGSNLRVILDEISQGKLAINVPLVVSNNAQAPALSLARDYGIATAAIPHQGLTREQHEEKLLAALAEYQIDYVILAGYMRILTNRFLNAFRHPSQPYFKVINIHPSLLPAFPGANAYEEAFSYGVRLSGITVHLVDEQVDHGPILAQETFPRLDTDDLETFKARGLAVEHQLYPDVLRNIAKHGITLLNQEPCRSTAAANHPSVRSNPQ